MAWPWLQEGRKPYPLNQFELGRWFLEDEPCRVYLESLRWPLGFVCPACSGREHWLLAGRLIKCRACDRKTSVTAATIFADTRTPLPVWFWAAWRMVDSQNGISARTLMRSLGIADYRLAFRILHRLRRVLVNPSRDRLVGPVEVDDTFVGGREKGVVGRETRSKVVVGVAVEARDFEKVTRKRTRTMRVAGRVRLQVMPNSSQESFKSFVRWAVESKAIVYTDSHPGIPLLTPLGFEHRRFNVRQWGMPAHHSLPHVHRVASLLKRWLKGTHQGSVKPGQIEFYLDEYTWRFNRRHWGPGARFRRLLQLAVLTPQVTYQALKAGPQQWQPQGGRALPATQFDLQDELVQPSRADLQALERFEQTWFHEDEESDD